MNRAYCVALLLLVIIHPLRQDPQPARLLRLETKYDRSADQTTVQCDLLEHIASPGRLMVQACASYRGKNPNETSKFRLDLAFYQGRAARRTPPIFREAKTLYLLIDSARREVPVIDYRSEFFELNRLLTEQAHAEIKREDLRKLLDAKQLSGKWGDVEFNLSNAELAGLKDFINRQVFPANSN